MRRTTYADKLRTTTPGTFGPAFRDQPDPCDCPKCEARELEAELRDAALRSEADR